MSHRLTSCNPDGSVFCTCSYGIPTALVPTTHGFVQVQNLVACTKSALTVGEGSYNSACGGLWTTGIAVEHLEGDTGAGHESRALAVTVVDKQITVTFGTDGAGASDPPTETELAALISGDADASALVVYTVVNGPALVQTLTLTNLAGGLDDGHRIKMRDSKPYIMLVNAMEVV